MPVFTFSLKQNHTCKHPSNRHKQIRIMTPGITLVATSQGDRHAVRSGISDDGKPQTCQANKLSDACTILLGFVKYIIAALSTE